MPLSEVREFFASKSFAGYRTGMESRQKVTMAILTRMDNLARGLGSLGKVLVAIVKRR